MELKIKQFRYGSDNLGYVAFGPKSAIAIDGGAVEDILSFVGSRRLELTYVANTHSHMDHTFGNQALLDQTGAKFLDFGTLLKQETIDIDGDPIRVIHTPGHTTDSVCFYFDSILVSGDTLFCGKVGRCFTGDLHAFLHSIKTLLKLPPQTRVYAGHDYVEEYMAFASQLEFDNKFIAPYLQNYDPTHVVATLAEELRVDPFLRFNDEKIIAILKNKGLKVKTEYDRWESLFSLM